MRTAKKICKDCEPAQVNHFIIRTSAYMGLFIKPMLKPLDYFTRVLLPPRSFSWFDIVAPRVLRTLAFFHIGKIETEVRKDDSDRTRCFWEEAKRRGIHMLMYRCGPIKDLFIAKYKGRTICFDGLPRPVGPEAESLYWMDNKPLMRTRFKEHGIPLAGGAVAFRERRAVEIFHSLQKPVIVKPYSGSRSRHTTVHLDTEESFLRAFRSAKVLSPLALIEEELEGFVHRGTLIGEKLIAVMRREPPHIIGDGIHTVRELVAEENKLEGRHGNTFHPIVLEQEAEMELVRQKLHLGSVPKKGQRS
ncbi:MAG: UDP-N-acetylmuramyl tripeptide synthase [Parcubacteria group bacterium GW2011_GWA2_49_9]|nr:MAG: UDP-N-acetylmuramyl tripeptide synthase [Parcubacteria group bacterium GW2011_GWA2_49_9]